MARTVLPIAGAIIGNMIAPGIGGRIGWMVGSVVGGVVDPVINKAPKLGDLQPVTAQDGGPRPIAYGTVIVQGQIICRGDPEKVIKRTGGKGGPVTEEERVYMTYAEGLCGVQIVAIRRAWRGNKLVYDATATGNFKKDSAKWIKNKIVYTGSSTQLPDPTLETIFGVGQTPAYRGTAYVVNKREDLTDSRGAVVPTMYEVVCAGTVADLTTSGFQIYKAGSDNDDVWTSTDFTSYSATKTRTPNINGQSLTHAGFAGARVKVNYSVSGSELIVAPASWGSTVTTTTSTTNGAGGRIRRWSPLVASHGGSAAGGSAAITLDGGVTWTTVPQCFAGQWIRDIVRMRSGRWVALSPNSGDGTSDSLYYCDDAIPTSWTYASTQPSGAANHVLGYNGINIVVGGSTAGQRLWLVADSQLTTWTAVNIPSTAYNVISDIINVGLTFFTCNGFNATAGGALWRSDDNGTTWRQLYEAAGVPLSYLTAGNGYIAAGVETNGQSKILVSDDDGDTFTLVNGPWATGIHHSVPVWAGPIEETVPEVTDQLVTVASIVTDLCARGTLSAAKIDTSLVPDTCRGYIVAGGSIADAIRGLQRPFQFDAAEYDKKIHFLPRGRANVFAFVVDNLIEGEAPQEDDETEWGDTIRDQEYEYPKVLHFMYSDPALNYEPSKQTSRRTSPDVRVKGELTVEVRVTLAPDEAAKIVDKMHKVAWIDLMGEVKISVPDSYSYLVPTDCGTLTWNGATRRLRIEKIEQHDGVMMLTCRHDRISAYSSTVTGVNSPAPAPPVSTVPGDTTLYVMNLPALIDAHDKLGPYVIGGGEESGWYGARLQRSTDSQVSWTEVATLQPGAVLGILKSDLGNHVRYVTDWTHTLKVIAFPPASEFDTLSWIQLLQEKNAIAVLHPNGTAEILQFKTAVDEGDGVWSLTGLIRGRLGTTPSFFPAGARFALLDSAHFLEMGPGLIDTTFHFRAPPFGTSPDESDVEAFTWTPAHAQRELAPCRLVASRAGALVTATWVPVHRFGSDVAPTASVNFQGWRVTITGGSGTITFDQTGTTLTAYNAAAVGTPSSITVAGINRITGAGATATGAL